MAEAVAAWGPADLAARLERAESVLAGRYVFLNHAELLPSIDWRRQHVSPLWTYNLHYFDYARDLAWAYRHSRDRRYLDRLMELADGWIEENTHARGRGWDPYPVSVRIVNWSVALLLCGDAIPAASQQRLVRSLHRQCRFLEQHIEWHILGNHLQRNLQALLVGGLLFDGDAAVRWRRKAARLLWGELDEQVLDDGGHYERSPMYHAVFVGDLLELLCLMRACNETVPPRATSRVRTATAALGRLSRPDGTLHRFSDSADGIALPRQQLERLARMGVDGDIPDPTGVWRMPDSGYFGYNAPEEGQRFIIDCGDPGPVYQPGHAHCDLLSFELDLAGAPFIVDSGVSGYDGDPLREYARSTRAHNTVTVDGGEQSEIWGTFRMARRAEAISAQVSDAPGRFHFRGAYRPYHDRRITHSRRVQLQGSAWEVEDRVSGAEGALLCSFLHFHPAIHIETEGRCFRAVSGEVSARIEPFGVDAACVRRGEHDPEQGWYCREFGACHAAPVLEFRVPRNDGKPFGYRIIIA
jgi:uncharacterized heparinase superfamily protein